MKLFLAVERRLPVTSHISDVGDRGQTRTKMESQQPENLVPQILRVRSTGVPVSVPATPIKRKFFLWTRPVAHSCLRSARSGPYYSWTLEFVGFGFWDPPVEVSCPMWPRWRAGILWVQLGARSLENNLGKRVLLCLDWSLFMEQWDGYRESSDKTANNPSARSTFRVSAAGASARSLNRVVWPPKFKVIVLNSFFRAASSIWLELSCSITP